MTQATGERRSRARLLGLVLISAFAAVAAVALGALATNFIQDTGPLVVLLAAAWLTLTVGRLAWYLDLPQGYGGVWSELGLGLALGLAGMGGLQLVVDGGAPGWALAAGAGWGIYRAHAPILRQNRQKGAPPRLLGGILDPREVGALALLVAGYALLGLALAQLYDAFRGIVPNASQALAIGAAVYALYGAKLLLKFAAHDATGPVKGGFLAWFKANLLRNAIVVLLLVAYWAYRDDLAEVVPYFPLVEFGLGMAVFGAVLARLRWRLRHDRTEHATASEARPHVPRAEPLSEGEYEAVARPIARFLESGRGAADYEAAVRGTARLEDPDAGVVLDPIRRYRAPHEDPPLPLAFAVGGAVAAGVALAVAAATLVVQLANVGQAEDRPLDPGLLGFAIQVGLVVLGLSVYRAQDFARAHRQPWGAFAIACVGAALVLLAVVLFLAQLPFVPAWAWGIALVVALLLVGIPLAMSWRLARRLEGPMSGVLPPELPSALLAKGLTGARRLAATAAVGAVVLLVVVPFVLGWLVKVAGVPEGVQRTYDAVASGAVWVLAAMGGSALVRFWGLSRSRPVVLAIERRRREERIQLHSEIMRRLERV